MRKKSIKVIAAALCATLSLGMLTACGGNSNSTSEASSGAPTSGADPAAVEPVKEFTYMGINTGMTTEEYNNYPLAGIIEEHTGYKVHYDQAPNGEDVTTAINNIFINRDDYQAICVSKDQFYSLLAQDALKDLTPFIENTKNMKNVISEFGWKTATKDGRIYGLPRKDPRVVCNATIVYREDWLKEYNDLTSGEQIPLPSEENGYTMSLSDFRTMLEYFKTKVPQGGAAFHVDPNAVVQESIMPAFGIYGEWSDVDGKLLYYVDHPNFGKYLEWMQGLFDDGLMTYAATSEEPSVVKLMQAEQLGAGRVFHWNAAAIEGSEGTDDRIGYIAVLVDDKNKGDVSKVRQFASEAYQAFTVVPKFATDEQAAAVIDWSDKTADEDFFRLMVLGEEGKTFTVKDDEYWPILPAFTDERNMADRYLTICREEDMEKYWLCRTRKTPAQDKLFGRTNVNIFETGIKSPIAVMPPNEVYDTKASTAQREVLTSLVQTMFSNQRMSVEELRQVYAANGGEEVTAAVNEWYSTWPEKDSYNPVKPID